MHHEFKFGVYAYTCTVMGIDSTYMYMYSVMSSLCTLVCVCVCVCVCVRN